MGLKPKLDAAANAAAVISVTNPRSVDWIVWSYDGAPTGGKITIKEGLVTLFEVDVTQGGPGQLLLNPIVGMTGDSVVTITLAAGGAGVTGKINAMVRV
jgi:hypothetical protein